MKVRARSPGASVWASYALVAVALSPLGHTSVNSYHSVTLMAALSNAFPPELVMDLSTKGRGPKAVTDKGKTPCSPVPLPYLG